MADVTMRPITRNDNGSITVCGSCDAEISAVEVNNQSATINNGEWCIKIGPPIPERLTVVGFEGATRTKEMHTDVAEHSN